MDRGAQLAPRPPHHALSHQHPALEPQDHREMQPVLPARAFDLLFDGVRGSVSANHRYLCGSTLKRGDRNACCAECYQPQLS